MADHPSYSAEDLAKLADIVKWSSADGAVDFLELSRAALGATTGISKELYASARMMQLFMVAAVEGGNEIINEHALDPASALMAIADSAAVAVACAAMSITHGRFGNDTVEILSKVMRAGMMRCLDQAIGEAQGNG